MEYFQREVTSSPVDVAAANHQFMMPAVQSMPQQGVKKTNSKGSSAAKKDTDKPKRPLSAYNLFFQAERANILKKTPSKYEGNKPRRSHGKIGFASLARSVAAKWNNIDPETRKHFDELAAADKARYKKEMDAWKAAQALKEEPAAPSGFYSGPLSMPAGFNAQTIVKCHLMATSQASQDLGRMVFHNRFQTFPGDHGAAACNDYQYPTAAPSSGGGFFFQTPTTPFPQAKTRTGMASAVVGEALALLTEEYVPTFQPLDDHMLEKVDDCLRTTNARSKPHISELAAKLDDDCLGFMSQFFGQ